MNCGRRPDYLYYLYGEMQCLCRFFFRRDDYDREARMYRDKVLCGMLPKLHRAKGDNEVQNGRGFVFPPFIVMERGTTMTDWLKQKPDPFFAIGGMVRSVAVMVKHLHASRRVHRDIKPDNLLFMASGVWRLLDLGIVANEGTLTGQVILACWHVDNLGNAGMRSVCAKVAPRDRSLHVQVKRCVRPAHCATHHQRLSYQLVNGAALQ